MLGRFSRGALFSCLACLACGSHAGEPAPPVVKTRTQLDALLATGQRTPLDALTPYGKRRFVNSISWGRRGIGGFDAGPLVQELDAAQLAAALRFLGSGELARHWVADLVGPPLRLPAPSTALEREVEHMRQLANALSEQRAAAPLATSDTGANSLVRHYEQTFGTRMTPANLKRQPLGDLPLLFDAAMLASDRDPGSAASRHVRLVHLELAARGVDTRRKLDDSLLRILLAAREFDEARRFAAGRPHLARRTIPAVVDPLGQSFRGRSVYALDASATLLTRQAVSLGSGLVMMVGAGCHFSRDALAAIGSDPALQLRLREAGLMLLVSPRSPIPLGYIAEWNAANPALPIRVPVSVGEWREIADASTPEFFLFKEGKLAGHLVGWPEGGHMAELRALLDTAHN